MKSLPATAPHNCAHAARRSITAFYYCPIVGVASWGPVSRESFDAQRGPDGALLIGEPDEVAEKIIRHSEALGGISRITFQMNASSLPHAKLMHAIEVIGTRVAPVVRQGLADD